MSDNPARENMRKLLETVIPDDVRTAVCAAYNLDLPAGSTYRTLLDARILQFAATEKLGIVGGGAVD